MKMRCFLLGSALCCLFAGSLYAHDYWIKPSRFHLTQPGWIGFDFTAAHDYFGMEENPLHQDFGLEVFGPDGQAEKQPVVFSGRLRAVGEVELAKSGTYVIAASSLKPLYYTQFKEGGGGYMSKDRAPKGQALRTGRYVKSIKTFVTVGQATDAVLTPRGYEIELVPQQHPSAVQSGSEVGFQVLYQGKPLTGVEVMAVREGFVAAGHGSVALKTKTDARGMARLSFAQPGIWLVYCLHVLETPNDPKADFSNYRAYLMLDVK